MGMHVVFYPLVNCIYGIVLSDLLSLSSFSFRIKTEVSNLIVKFQNSIAYGEKEYLYGGS